MIDGCNESCFNSDTDFNIFITNTKVVKAVLLRFAHLCLGKVSSNFSKLFTEIVIFTPGCIFNFSNWALFWFDAFSFFKAIITFGAFYEIRNQYLRQ
jgi:hypothetical protein